MPSDSEQKLTMKQWRNLWHRYHTWVGIVVSGILVFGCYGFALRLPFFFDDLPVMTWVGRHSLADIWTMSSEGSFYRPLTFTVYKLGLLFPQGARQVVLHAVNLLAYWISAALAAQVVKLCGKSYKQALLTSVLFAVFPFMFLAVPWITAMPHHLATVLTLLAVYAALKAERDHATVWWGISLAATLLASFAHESGQVCGFIVAGWVIIQHGIRSGRRRIVGIVIGMVLSVGTFLLRNYIPGVGNARLAGLQDYAENTMFFLHGLAYPVAPIIGWLVHHRGGHDFTLIKIATASLGLLLVWTVRRSRDWRWAACSLCWWAGAALPAVASLRYSRLYISPRLYALSSVGIVMLWAYIIIELGRTVRHMWGRRLIWGLLAGLIVVQNVAFIYRYRDLHVSLNQIYQRVLEAAQDKENSPLGFVNLPRSLAYPEKTYAMIQEAMLFVPAYSNITEFIEVNGRWRAAETVMFSPVLQETGLMFGFQGDGVDWEGMHRFASEHRTVWLARWREGRFSLDHVGSIEANATPLSNDPLVRFEGGPVIESARVEQTSDGHWAVTITWLASGLVDAKIFVHVRDADGNVVAQADGPALGGMVPLWLWRSGDRIYDVRHIFLTGSTPHTVQVGLFNEEGRLPAFVDGVRCPDDAAPVATLAP